MRFHGVSHFFVLRLTLWRIGVFTLFDGADRVTGVVALDDPEERVFAVVTSPRPKGRGFLP
jgi:hypothetical protein